MRMGWVVALGVMSACTTQGVERARRWPAHRQQGDARFTELERKVTELEQRNSELDGRVKTLEASVAHVKMKPAPADGPPVDPPPVAAP